MLLILIVFSTALCYDLSCKNESLASYFPFFSVCRLGRIKGYCNQAVFHPSAPILAVLQPPCGLHIFQVGMKFSFNGVG